ncbi:hypothetical protein GOP47_0009250 [Adiantum capillus-veneris]|uniref:C2 NT-type domain-containing protein n=1 Tax=Adiantum capillus-veneris TaxID=13818 RepID=A0A9D4ZH18_ADICA|nr:hypothetical protein GOP47_0009250 [Adiantum capillus-veneris]
MVLGLSHLRKRKIHSRRCRARFIYRLQLIEIKPWFSSQQTLASSQSISVESFILRWHRGSRRSGLAQNNVDHRTAKPDDSTIPFNHAFELPVTLHCSSPAAFEEKLIVFTLLDAQYSAGPPVARGSLNLAAYGASGIDINGPVTSTVRIPLILCRHVTSKVVVPHLHILITPRLCKSGCFGEGEFQSKAHSITRYLPTQTVCLLRKRDSSPPPLDSSSRQALVAALLKEEGEHQEEEEEAELEPFTDDESSSGLHTPHEKSTFDVHPKANIMAIEDKILRDSNSPPLSSRISAAQVAWTPTPKRHGLDEAMAPLRTASEFYHSSKEDFITLYQDRTGTLSLPCSASIVKEIQHEHFKPRSHQGLDSDDKKSSHANDSSSSLQMVDHMHPDVNIRAGHPVEIRGTTPTEIYHDHSNFEPTDLKMQRHPKGDSDTGNFDHATEAEALRKRIISQLHENRLLRLSFEDLDTDLMADNDEFNVEEDINVLEEARRKFAEGADKRNAEVTKRLLEETKTKLIDLEAKLFTASEKVSFLQLCMGALEGELQDVATIEMSVFSTVVEHGESPNSVLVCACQLTKLLIHAITNWSQQRRASLMRSTISGLLLATRACGQDVARLTFWWSNVLALRHAFVSSFSDNLPVSTNSELSVVLEASKGCSPIDPKMYTAGDNSAVHESGHINLSNAATFIRVLEKVEASIYIKVMEAVWSQVFAPLTHKAAYPSAQQGPSSNHVDKDNAQSSKDNESTSMVFDLEDGVQQNSSIDIWKKAFLSALEKLCPVLSGGKNCSCVSGLPRLVIEECVARLDVLMFNAIVPIPESELSKKPMSDVAFGADVLPICPGHMTFGTGMQLKNAVGTWSTWLTIILEKLTSSAGNAANDESRRFISFPMLKALADLLMLPRDMVADKSVRKEVCPVLTLPVVRRVMSMVEPDEFAPDAVSPSLLAALNAEIEMEKRMLGDVEGQGFSVDGVALQPMLSYCPHSTTFKELIERMLDSIVSKWVMQNDGEVLHDLKTMSAELVQTITGVIMSGTAINSELPGAKKLKTCCPGAPLHRYKLLEELGSLGPTGQAPKNVVSED